MLIRLGLLMGSFVLAVAGVPQEEAIFERGEKLLEQAKAAYESAREKASATLYVECAFTLEEARIKFLVLQEIGSPEKQKLAADRLRAINQLSKLIHDGRVAISGKAVEERPSAPPGESPASPEPKTPIEAPAARPLKARFAVPDAAALREAEKQIRDLYKENLGRKAPADRIALAREFLEQASRSAVDVPSRWVYLHEALGIFIQLGDLGATLRAADAIGSLFDTDAFAVRSAALAGIAKGAKTREELAASAGVYLKLVDDLIAIDDYAAAEKAAVAAVGLARRSADPALLSRANLRTRTLPEARAKFESMTSSLEVLARNPQDPSANLEMGQFLCFIKSDWELGLRFLLKGSDTGLQTLSQRDLALPLEATEQVAVGDGWWELAEKEKSPLKKERLQERARLWYQSAFGQVPALLKSRLEKRLALPLEGPVDLLTLIDPKADAVEGEWSLAAGKLSCTKVSRNARLQTPVQLPDEYDLALVVTRVEGGEAILLGLSTGEVQFNLAIDSWNATATGLGLLDGKHINDNESTFKGPLLKNGKASTIACSVRKEGLTLVVDGKKIVTWKQDYKRLSPLPEWKVSMSKALVLGCCNSKYEIQKFTLTPQSPGGGRLR